MLTSCNAEQKDHDLVKMTPKVPHPINVKAPHGATVMHIEWSDGHLGVYPHDILRGYCPCAECQGHSGTIKFREGGNTEIRELTTVGNYALTITWGDKHGSGIYNFEYLRLLCQCPECKPPDSPAVPPPIERK
ncbi:MAG: hypothetical protein CSA75_00470 [Sorangium cellulosum]|nr:MAG: hypothetical protein CSA75_00470 [Sorangium cellulosum]